MNTSTEAYFAEGQACALPGKLSELAHERRGSSNGIQLRRDAHGNEGNCHAAGGEISDNLEKGREVNAALVIVLVCHVPVKLGFSKYNDTRSVGERKESKWTRRKIGLSHLILLDELGKFQKAVDDDEENEDKYHTLPEK